MSVPKKTMDLVSGLMAAIAWPASARYGLAEYYPAFARRLAAQGTTLSGYAQREFADYLKCERLEHGFLRVRCDSCHAEHLVAFSCKRRGFCPSCRARRMAEGAALFGRRGSA